MPIELFNIEKGYSVFSHGYYETEKHTHYAIEIVFCTEGSFDISTNLSDYTNIKSVIIPSNIPHRFSCLHATCNLLFLDPLSDIGIYFLQQYHLASQIDFRISTCIQTISANSDDKLTLAQLSRTSFLSESRLAHLFKKQLGISVHQCILWKKILLAVLKSREGYSLTECAHYVGFSDSSHFNKVFYKMFGVNPFFVLKD